MIYAELAYFPDANGRRNHCAHVATWEDHNRLAYRMLQSRRALQRAGVVR